MVQQLFANDAESPFQNQELKNSPVPWKLVAPKQVSLDMLHVSHHVANDEKLYDSHQSAMEVVNENQDLLKTEDFVPVEEEKTEEKARNLSDDYIVDVMKESTYMLV